jgi:single-strand DNA-binding protein
MYLNKVILIGRVSTDIQLRSTNSGQNVCSFRLATNRTFKDSSGQKKEDAQFHNIVLWGNQAQIASRYLTKGSLVLIEGRLQNRTYEDQSGNKKYITEVVGERIQLGPKGAKINPAGTDEQIPIIETEEKPEEEGEIDVKDIPL